MAHQLTMTKACGYMTRGALAPAVAARPAAASAARRGQLQARRAQPQKPDAPRAEQLGQPLAPPAAPRAPRRDIAASAASVDAPAEDAARGGVRQDWPLVAAATAAVAAAAAAGLLMLSPSLPLDPADEPLFAPAAKTLADTLPAKFRGLDANRDGFITRAELAPLETELWLKWSEGAAPDVAGDANAFERYGDTPLPAGQAMHYLGLEAAITPNGCVAAGVWQVFDSNADGAVDRREWGAALGDLGADGNAAKRLVFDRVDRVSGSGGALAPEQFQTALGQIRGVVAGGGGAEGVVFGLGK